MLLKFSSFYREVRRHIKDQQSQGLVPDRSSIYGHMHRWMLNPENYGPLTRLLFRIDFRLAEDHIKDRTQKLLSRSIDRGLHSKRIRRVKKSAEEQGLCS